MGQTNHHGDHNFLSGELKKFRFEKHATLAAADMDGTPREGRVVYALSTKAWYVALIHSGCLSAVVPLTFPP